MTGPKKPGRSFVHGLYGKARDDLIARSKLVLNVCQYPAIRVFEIARASYLFANRKAVISDFSPVTKIEDDIRATAILVPVERVADTCVELLENDQRRLAAEEAGFVCIAKRDIRKILSAALS